jgi:hypothetical protein
MTATEAQTKKTVVIPRAVSVKVLLAKSFIEKRLDKQGCSYSYEDLRADLGEDPQRDGRSVVSRACRLIERDRAARGIDCVIAPIRRVGIKWLTEEETVLEGPRYRKRINRLSRRAMRVMATVAGKDLNGEGNITRDTCMAAFALTERAMSPAGQKKLAAVMTGSGRLLGIEETLKALK